MPPAGEKRKTKKRVGFGSKFDHDASPKLFLIPISGRQNINRKMLTLIESLSLYIYIYNVN